LEEIRVELDRRAVKRKRRKSRFASPSAPNQKEEKMLGVLRLGRQFEVAEASLSSLFVLSRKTHLISDTTIKVVVWLLSSGSMINFPYHSPTSFSLTFPQGPWDLPNSPVSFHSIRNAKLNSGFAW